jgi:LmbE family N-acetylglucosaminyl deacetylase
VSRLYRNVISRLNKVPPSDLKEIARSVRRWQRGRPVVDLPTGTSVLVVAPHPDDETLMAGGTMARMVAEGVAVHVLIATGGEATQGVAAPAEDIVARRREEAVAACRIIGAGTPEFADLPDGSLENHTDELAAVLARITADFGITTIMAPWWLDGHPDHRAIATALCDADLADSTIVWSGEIWTPLVPNRIVDVTDQIEDKRRAIREYELAGEAFDLDAVLGLNRYRSVSGLGGHGFAEAFVALPIDEFRTVVRQDRG